MSQTQTVTRKKHTVRQRGHILRSIMRLFMDSLVYLQTKYDKNIKPAWTVKEPIHQKARHVKFTELCKFAQFYIDIEPYESYYPVVLINSATLQEDMVGDKD